MKRMISLVCAVCFAAVALAGCQNGDVTSGPMAVVAKVNGVSIYRWEVDRQYEINKDIYEQQAEVNLEDTKNFSLKQQYKEFLLENLISDVATKEYAAENGYGLTEEERAQVVADLDAYFKENIDAILSENYGGDESKRDKAEKDWEKRLSDNHLSYDFLLETNIGTKVHEKLTEALYSGKYKTDEELMGTYDQMLKDYEEKYADSTAEFASDASVPGQIPYQPEGYARVKYVLISLPEQIVSKLTEINTKFEQDLVDQIGDGLTVEGGDGIGITPNEALTKQFIETLQNGLAQIKSTADAMMDELNTGATMDELIEKYNADNSDMKRYPGNEYGVIVGVESGHDEDLVQAVLKLKNPGDRTELIGTTNGYVVAELVKKIEPGPVPFEDVKEFISEMTNTSALWGVRLQYAADAVAYYGDKDLIERFANRL